MAGRKNVTTAWGEGAGETERPNSLFMSTRRRRNKKAAKWKHCLRANFTQ